MDIGSSHALELKIDTDLTNSYLSNAAAVAEQGVEWISINKESPSRQTYTS